MSVQPVLGDWEIPHISQIEILENRSMVQIAIPGRSGNVYQDMNTQPAKIVIHGSVYGEEARSEFVQKLREKYYAGEPVTFVADIASATEIQYVVIETLHVVESGKAPDQFEFTIIIRESPPPPPEDTLGGIDDGLMDMGDNLLDSVNGAMDLVDQLGDLAGMLDGLGTVPDIVNPTPPLNDAMNGVTAATQGLSDALGPIIDIFGSDD